MVTKIPSKLRLVTWTRRRLLMEMVGRGGFEPPKG
jgi:hypothetical protein